MATGRYTSAVQQHVHCQRSNWKRSAWKGQGPPPKAIDAILAPLRADRRSADDRSQSTPAIGRTRRSSVRLSAASRDEPRLFDFEITAVAAPGASACATGAIAAAVMAVSLAAAPSAAAAAAAVSPAVSAASHHVPLGLRILHHTVSGLFSHVALNFRSEPAFPGHQGAAPRAVVSSIHGPKSCLVMTLMTPHDTVVLRYVNDYCTGGLGGAIGAAAVYPIDVVKTRLQAQRDTVSDPYSGSDLPLYNGPLDCFATIMRTEGLSGLYGGLVAQLVGVWPDKVKPAPLHVLSAWMPSLRALALLWPLPADGGALSYLS